MDLGRLTRLSESEWRLEPASGMRVPAVIFGDATLLGEMEIGRAHV